MISETSYLDEVKTTVSVSMKTKNDLKKLKGSLSYDEFIRTLIRNQNKKNVESKNSISFVNFDRTKGIYRVQDFVIIYAYNKYLDIPNFRFDIEIIEIRKKGKKVPIQEYINNHNTFEDYFKILESIIQKDIEPMFKFRKYGREDYKDYIAWERHFNNLNISGTALQEDVIDKLHNEKRSPYA